MNLDESQNKDDKTVPDAADSELSPVDAQNGQPQIQNSRFQFQLGSLMLVITLIGVILGLGRLVLAWGIAAFILFATCLILTSKAVNRREKEGFSESNTTWIFLCSFAYVSTIIILLGSILVPVITLDIIVQILMGAEDIMPFSFRLALLVAAIAFEVAWWFVFLYVRRIWRRAIGQDKDSKRTDSPEVNQ